MKNLLRITTLIILISFLAGCAGAPAAPAATDVPAGGNEQPATDVPATEIPATAVPATVAPLSPQEEWLKANQLGSYDTGEQDWAAIEAAAIAEGEVLVYANTSKVEKAAEAFMEKYPGIKVQAFDLGGDDVLLKTVEEQKAEAYTGDVWFSSGGAELGWYSTSEKLCMAFHSGKYSSLHAGSIYRAIVDEPFRYQCLCLQFGIGRYLPDYQSLGIDQSGMERQILY